MDQKLVVVDASYTGVNYGTLISPEKMVTNNGRYLSTMGFGLGSEPAIALASFDSTKKRLGDPAWIEHLAEPFCASLEHIEPADEWNGEPLRWSDD